MKVRVTWTELIQNLCIFYFKIIEAGKSERSFIFGGLTPETQYTASVSGVLIAGRREVKSPAGQDSGLTGIVTDLVLNLYFKLVICKLQ